MSKLRVHNEQCDLVYLYASQLDGRFPNRLDEVYSADTTRLVERNRCTFRRLASQAAEPGHHMRLRLVMEVVSLEDE